MSKKKKPQIEYRIAEIKRVSYFENDLSELGLKKNEIDTGNVGLDMKMIVNEKTNLLKFETAVVFSHSKKNLNVELFGIKTIHVFEIKNMVNAFPRNEKSRLDFPDGFLQTLLAITIGSIRGMMVISITNKDYENIFLPVVNVKNLLSAVKSPVK